MKTKPRSSTHFHQSIKHAPQGLEPGRTAGSLAGRAFAVVLVGALAVGASAEAAPYSWTAGGSGIWNSSDSNWGGAGSVTLWDSVTGPTNTADFSSIAAPAAAAIDSGGVNAGTLTLSGTQPVTLSGTGQVKVSSLVNVNDGANLTIAGSAKLDTTLISGGNHTIAVGTSGSGTLTVQDAALVYLGFDNYLNVGGGGTVDVKGGDLAPWRVYFQSACTILVEGGNLVSGGAPFMYYDSGYTSSNGDWRSSGGANITMTSGRLGGFGWSDMGLCTFNISGGLFVAGGTANNRTGNGGDTTFNLSGGEVRWADRSIQGGANASAFHLGGNSLMVMRSVSIGTGTIAFNLDGGTLRKLNSALEDFIPAGAVVNVQAGGALIDTAGFDTWIGTGLAHDAGLGATRDGGLVKLGEGNLTLTEENSYTGDTVVEAGTLSVSFPSFADDADVRLADAATLNLDLAAGDKDVIGRFIIDGTPQQVGIWGRIGSIADYGAQFESEHITGNGLLNVTSAAVPSAPYDIWLAKYPSLTGVDRLATADPDGDGLINRQEFAFGTDPTSGASVNPIVTGFDKAARTFTYQRRKATGLTYKVQVSTSLNLWTPDETATEGLVITIGDNENVTVTLANPPSGPALFIRVKAD